MKRIFVLLLTLLMVVSMAGCKKEKGTETVKDNGEQLEVGICIYKFDDNFMTLYREELQSYMETTYNAKVTVMDGKGDQAEQTNQIQNFITQGVDVLILNLVQATSTEVIADMCAEAGIPVIFINREPSESEIARWSDKDMKASYVGADARQSGTFQGEIILEQPDKGDINGDGKVSYSMIIGDPENIDAKYRTEYSVKALTDAGMQVEELFAQRGDWDQAKGQELAANALTQFGDKVEVIFCNNDAMANGAKVAIESAGRTVGKDIYLVGVDALDETVAYVKEGTVTGTVLNDHVGQSHTAADVAAKMAKGEKVEHKYTVDYVKVTSDGNLATGTSEEAKDFTVGISIYKFDDNFMTLYREELQSYFESTYNAKVTVMDGKGDQAEQTNQIQNFITQGVDLLVLNLVQASSTEVIADMCAEAGIPAVFINREPSEDELNRWKENGMNATYVGADARQSGTFQGEIILEQKDKGDINGDGVISYVMIIGDPENVDAKYRTEYSVKALTDSGMQVKELFAQRGDWDQAKGQELTANALTQFGNEVEVIFCNNDAMANGAKVAIESAGRTVGKDIYLVGVDALDETVQYVKEGTVTGTVLNDHVGQSHTAADVGAKMVAGIKVEEKYTVDYVKVK
jgi:ABC-type sugar transport system substrate-binding protein